MTPSFPELEKHLTIREKAIECTAHTKWQTKMVYKKKPLFTVIAETPRTIRTYQGLWKSTGDWLRSKGYTVEFHDTRMPFDAPNFKLMRGFRFSQRELLTEFLNQRKSGLLVAPTRFGKIYLILNTLRAFPNVTSVVALPGVDLVKQTYEFLKEQLPDREVKMIGAGSRVKFPSEDINVASTDSLEKCDTGRTGLLLLDEPHTCVTDSRLPKIMAFDRARILGFTATPGGRFDGRDPYIIGAIGPVLAERTYLEAVAEGAICPLTVLFLEVKMDWTEQGSNRQRTYDRFLFKSPKIADITSRICHEILPDDWQTLIFIKHEEQAELFLNRIGEEGTIAMAKRMTAKERDATFKLMQSNTIKRCLATNIYATGVTFNNVCALINCEAGGDNTSAIQKPGRLAELRPDKKCGVIFDFMFDAAGLDTSNLDEYSTDEHYWKHLVRDSRARESAYRRKGYDVRIAKSFDELKTIFEEVR